MTFSSNNYNSRILLQRLKKTLSEVGDAQARLNEIVKIIALSMKSEVCSIYLMSNNNDNAQGKDVDEYAAPPKHESKRILVANLCLLLSLLDTSSFPSS